MRQYPRSNPPPVELFGPWRSATAEGNCVEIAHGPEDWVAVRDSKDEGHGPVLRFTGGEWTFFKAGLANGKLT
jgi:hypothetical protein